MKFSTNKEKGNSGLGIAIAYYSTNGYIVSIFLRKTFQINQHWAYAINMINIE